MQVKRSLSNQQAVTLKLGTPLGHGGEARVYAVPSDETLVAKIYHEPTATVAAKLAVMMENPPDNPTQSLGHISIAWPVDVLQQVDNDTRVVGFLMPRIRGMRSIIDFYNPKTRRLHCPRFNYYYLHRTARNLAASVAALHARGYCIGDVNESNILVSDKALVTLVDTDSFQVRDPQENTIYRCEVGKPEFTPPELQDQTFAECDRTTEHDLFGLAVLIFQLLMEGTHPFSGIYLGAEEPPPYEVRIQQGHFTYSQKRRVPYTPNRIAPSWDILHPRLQELFVRTFEEGHTKPKLRASAQNWLTALTEAENSLITCSVNHQHRYGNHLPKCPWCDRALQLGGRDPFPSLQAIQQRKHLQALPPKSVIARKELYPRYVHASRSVTTYKLKLKPKFLPLICGLLGMATVGLLNITTNFANSTINFSNNDETITKNAGKINNLRSYKHYYQQGKTLYNSRNYDLAIENLNQAIESNPRDAKAYIQRGNARYNLKDYEGAIKDFNSALYINPQAVKAYVNRGNVRHMLASYSSTPDQEYKKALSDFNHAISIDPNEAEAYIRRSIVHYERAQYSGDSKRDYIRAIADLNRALRLNPRKAEALFRRGIIRYEIAQYSGDFDKQYQQAIEDFNSALHINPRLPQVYAQRGIVRYELAQYGNNNSEFEHLQSVRDLQTAAKLFLDQGDIDNYQKALSNICMVIENKCDSILQNSENHLLLGSELLTPVSDKNH